MILAGFTKTGDNYDNRRDIQIPSVSSSGNPADIFVSLMLLVGFGLIIVPEFFYLRDFFGTRMNTIFKFYYQVWILMGLASAYLWNRLNQILEGKKTWLLNGSMMAYYHLCIGISDFWNDIQDRVFSTEGNISGWIPKPYIRRSGIFRTE